MHEVNKIPAKERHRRRLLEFMGDWENIFPRRTDMPEVLGIKRVTLYKHFTPNELREIENEGLELRKKNSGKERAEIYQSMLDEAKAGGLGSQKEFLDRTEGKVIDKLEATGKDGSPLLPTLSIEELIQLQKMIAKK